MICWRECASLLLCRAATSSRAVSRSCITRTFSSTAPLYLRPRGGGRAPQGTQQRWWVPGRDGDSMGDLGRAEVRGSVDKEAGQGALGRQWGAKQGWQQSTQ